MANQDQVLMENIKNPSVKRYFTPASARQQTKKWRVVNQTQTEEVKKKVVKPAVEKSASLPKQPETGNSFTNEFAKIGEADQEKEALQVQYEELTGTKPDGRWNVEKLKQKIEGTKNNTQ